MSSIGVTASLVNAGGSIEASFWSTVGLVDVIVGSTYVVSTSESTSALGSGSIGSVIPASATESSSSAESSLYSYIAASSSTPGVSFNYSNIGGSIEASLWASVGVNESGVGVGTTYSASSTGTASASESSSYAYVASTIGVAGISYSFQGTGGSIDAAPWLNISVISGPFSYPVTTADSANATDYYSTGSAFIISRSEPVSGVDSPSALLTKIDSSTGISSAVDAPSTLLSASSSYTDSSSAVDLVTVGTQPVSIMVEYGFSIDATTSSYSSYASSQENVTLSDSAIAGYSAFTGVVDSVSATEVTTINTGITSSFVSSAVATDVVVTGSATPASEVEAISAIDSNSPSFAYQISSSEFVLAADVTSKLALTSVVGIESGIAGEIASPVLEALSIGIEQVSAIDSIISSPIFPLDQSGSTTAISSQTSSASFSAVDTEVTNLVDSPSAVEVTINSTIETSVSSDLNQGADFTSGTGFEPSIAVSQQDQRVELNTTVSEVLNSSDQQDSARLFPVAAIMSATSLESTSVVTSFSSVSAEQGAASASVRAVAGLTLIYSDTGYAKDLPGIAYFDSIVEKGKALDTPAITSLVGSHKLPTLHPSGSRAKLFNLVIQKGTSYQLTMSFIDGKIGLPIDLSGFDGILTVSNDHTQPPAISLSVTNGGLVLGETPGTVIAYFPPEATASINWSRASYRMSVTGTNSGKTLMMKGLVTVVHTPFSISANPLASSTPGTGAAVTIPSNQAYYMCNSGSETGASSSYFAASNIDWSQ
jgi:hypothetical protein